MREEKVAQPWDLLNISSQNNAPYPTQHSGFPLKIVAHQQCVLVHEGTCLHEWD